MAICKLPWNWEEYAGKKGKFNNNNNNKLMMMKGQLANLFLVASKILISLREFFNLKKSP
jgi:hypothetical protein